MNSIRRNSDLGSSLGYKRFSLGGEGVRDLHQENPSDQDSDSIKKSELVKYAEVLRGSRRGTPKLHRKCKSFRATCLREHMEIVERATVMPGRVSSSPIIRQVLFRMY
ncbi:hypothetical protein L1049_005457 [Liquidambar formosana]|uniref:Uncharacterized protein n=1 Tax=Liquidambar formosana TaxID=63359 RepID=A0AAP0WZ88_LIQFO